MFDGRYPVIGAWIVGDQPAGMGIREVLVIVGGKSVGDVVELLGDGRHFGLDLGIDISHRAQRQHLTKHLLAGIPIASEKLRTVQGRSNVTLLFRGAAVLAPVRLMVR